MRGLRLYNDSCVLVLSRKTEINLNAVDNKTGQTPAHLAVDLDRVDLLLMLLDNGASLDKYRVGGMPPLLWAVHHDKSPQMMKVLVERTTSVSNM